MYTSTHIITHTEMQILLYSDLLIHYMLILLISFRFEIRPVNKVGRGGDETMATVIVPEKSEVLMFPSRFQVIVYTVGNNSIYGIKWNITKEKITSQNIESVTIYWCKRRQYEERCLVCFFYFYVNLYSDNSMPQHMH